jgi:hypothetical protein
MLKFRIGANLRRACGAATPDLGFFLTISPAIVAG